MRGPAHPLVDEDGVGPHLVSDDHRLERVCLQKSGSTVFSKFLFKVDSDGQAQLQYQ